NRRTKNEEIILLSWQFGFSEMTNPSNSITNLVKTYLINPITGTALKIQDDGSININKIHQYDRALNLKFIRVVTPPAQTLSAPIALDDTILSVSSTTGMAAGLILGVVNPDGSFFFSSIISFVVDTSVTVDTPSDTIIQTANTSILVATDEMTSLGGTLASPVIYQIAGVGAGSGIEIDITRVMGVIEDDDAMNNSLFGGEPALTNGVVLRHTDGDRTNYWNVKTNGDLKRICFDANYDASGPAASQYNISFRNSYAGEDKHGVNIRIKPGETLEVWIQDPMANDSFKMNAQGHFVVMD
ncbi:MAG: hypothetical protein KAS30_01810, partial [Candidatus Diapherotrites archaeon]|nr:hypothetical protein [Candidatus Diapherotrites archaeon]